MDEDKGTVKVAYVVYTLPCDYWHVPSGTKTLKLKEIS